MEGDLNVGDQKAFIDTVLGIEDAVIMLRSDGGSIEAALAIGKAIRLKGFTTLVLDGHRCASACALIWLGGQTRFMAADAEIGFHAAYELNNGASIERGAPNALIGGYLAGLGYSDDAIFYVTRAPPEGMSWLTFEMADELGINVRLWETAVSAKDKLPATPEPLPSTPIQEPDNPPESPTPPNRSMEAETVARGLAAALVKVGGSQGTYVSAEAEGGDVAIKNLRVSLGAGKPIITFEQTLVEAPQEAMRGGFESRRVTFTAGTISGSSAGSINAVTLTGVRIFAAGDSERGSSGEGILFDTAEASDFRARSSEVGEITVARIYLEAGNFAGDIPQDISGLVEDIVFPTAFFANSTIKPAMLGYERIVLDLSWDVSSDASGTMTVRDLSVSVEKGGSLSIKGVVENVSALSPPNSTEASAKMMLHRVSIQYEDHSLVGRLLDYLAAQQTGPSPPSIFLGPVEAAVAAALSNKCQPPCSRADYVRQLGGEIAVWIPTLNKAEVGSSTDQAHVRVIDSLKTFLHNPQSLTINIEPNPPISGEEVLALVEGLPQPFLNRLGVSVLATSDAGDDLADTDIPDGDKGTLPSGFDYSGCKEQCGRMADCVAVTFFNRVCYLKETVGERRLHPGATSWVKP